jgi:hypothetical protein
LLISVYLSPGIDKHFVLVVQAILYLNPLAQKDN